MKRIGTARKPLAKSLHDRIDVELQQIQENRALVRSFFRAQSVSYIRECHKRASTHHRSNAIFAPAQSAYQNEDGLNTEVDRLAWISTERNSPHKKFARMLIFSNLLTQSCYANRYADSSISLRLLAHRLLDSGHFGAPRGAKTLRAGVYQNTNLPASAGIFPES